MTPRNFGSAEIYYYNSKYSDGVEDLRRLRWAIWVYVNSQSAKEIKMVDLMRLPGDPEPKKYDAQTLKEYAEKMLKQHQKLKQENGKFSGN